MKVSDWEKILARESLSKYLPYSQYENGIYFLKDGGAGIAFECVPLCFLNGKVETGLQSLLVNIPTGASFQVILYAGSDICGGIDRWASLKSRRDGLWGEVIENYKQFLERKRHEGISRNFSSNLKNYRLFFTIKLGGKENAYSLLSDYVLKLFRNKTDKTASSSDPYEGFKDNVNKLLGVKDKIHSSLENAFLQPVELPPDQLVDLAYKILNPSHNFRDIPKWDGTDMSLMCISYDTACKVHEDSMEIDGICGRSLSIKEYPEDWSLANVANYIGDVFLNTSFGFNHLLVLNGIKLPDKSKSDVKRSASIVLAQKMPYSLFPRLKLKHQDLTYGMERIEKGEDLYHINLSSFIFANDKNSLEKASGQIKSHFRGINLHVEEDRYIHLPVLLSDLPFGWDAGMQKFLARGRVVFSDNVVTLMPVFTGWKGNKNENLFILPQGQLVGFDLFSNNAGGYNSFIVGMTGSGKSVMLQYLAANYLLAGDRVWIIDIGRSYEKLAHVLGGEFINLSLQNPICINPFSAIENESMLEEYLEFLINLLYLMGSAKEITLALEQEKIMRSYLEEAIKEAYRKNGSDTNVDEILSCLDKHKGDYRVSDFIRCMMPYTTNGIYGRFFNGKSEISFHAPLVVFENVNIEDIPDLRDPAIMILTFHISKAIYLTQSKHRNVVIIDESHKFLPNPKIALFIEQAYRKFRKDGAAIVLGTQGFEDFFDAAGEMSKAGRIVVENSYWKFFMMQTSTSRQSIKQSQKITLGDYEWKLMESIHPVAGEYGEGMLISEAGSEKVRLVLDDFLKTLFFSDPTLRRKMSELVSKGMSYTDAVRKLQKEVISA